LITNIRAIDYVRVSDAQQQQPTSPAAMQFSSLHMILRMLIINILSPAHCPNQLQDTHHPASATQHDHHQHKENLVRQPSPSSFLILLIIYYYTSHSCHASQH
jgi:hypothetical protein